MPAETTILPGAPGVPGSAKAAGTGSSRTVRSPAVGRSRHSRHASTITLTRRQAATPSETAQPVTASAQDAATGHSKGVYAASIRADQWPSAATAGIWATSVEPIIASTVAQAPAATTAAGTSTHAAVRGGSRRPALGIVSAMTALTSKGAQKPIPTVSTGI